MTLIKAVAKKKKKQLQYSDGEISLAEVESRDTGRQRSRDSDYGLSQGVLL